MSGRRRWFGVALVGLSSVLVSACGATGSQVPTTAPPAQTVPTPAPTVAPAAQAKPPATAPTPTPVSAAAPAVPTKPAAAPAAPAAPVTKPPVSTQPGVPAPGAAAQTSQPGTDKGITLGRPILLRAPTGLVSAGLLVRNQTPLVKTFTVKATYMTGGQVTGTATGPVADLLPGARRIALLNPLGQFPERADNVRTEVNAVLREQQTTPAADVARLITFGQPQVTGQGVTVPVTNGDSVPRSFTVQAGFLKGEDVLGVASGVVQNLAPGQVAQAALVGQGTLTGQDEIILAVDTVF